MPSVPSAPRRNFPSRVWRVFWLTLVKYVSIDGEQRAASFAYYAFFALFPMLLLLVSIGSYLFNPASVSSIVTEAASHYLVVDTGKHDLVRDTIHGVVKSRRGAGVVAVLVLLWSSFRCFQSLVRGVNRAWGTHERTWWLLPIHNLIMVGIVAFALIVSMVAPPALLWAQSRVEHLNLHLGIGLLSTLFGLVRYIFPSLVLFAGLSVFYKLAPQRRTTFSEVWLGAAVGTLLIQLVQFLFILYARNIAHFNVIYGAFGSVIAALVWVYLTGSIIILGGCFCAAKAEAEGRLQYPAALESDSP